MSQQLSQDTEVKIWLRETLGYGDAWNSSQICSKMNPDLIREIKCSMHGLPTQVKLKTLLSFLHLSHRNLNEWKQDIEDLFKHALNDSEASVRMLAEILQPFPRTRQLNVDIEAPECEETRNIFKEFSADLITELEEAKHHNLISLECYYMNRTALEDIWTGQRLPVQHFNIKCKTKAEKLRQELIETSNKNKASVAETSAQRNSFPARIKVVPKKISYVFRKDK